MPTTTQSFSPSLHQNHLTTRPSPPIPTTSSPMPTSTLHQLALHLHSKGHSPNRNRRQNRHLPPHTRISSLLHNRRTSSPRSRTSRSSRIRRCRHKPRSNKTRRLRQLAVNRRLRLNPRRKRHYRRQADGFVGGVIARLRVRGSRVEDFVDDVQDAVFDQDVCVDDAGGVDEDRAVGADGDV